MRDALRHNGAVTAVAVAPAVPVTAVEPAEDDGQKDRPDVRIEQANLPKTEPAVRRESGRGKAAKLGGAKVGSTSGAPPRKQAANRADAPPRKDAAVPAENGRGKPQKRGGWIEFKPGAISKKTGDRMYYAKRRMWVRRGGQWIKKWIGRVAEIPPMTEAQKDDYVKRKQRAQRAKKRK